MNLAFTFVLYPNFDTGARCASSLRPIRPGAPCYAMPLGVYFRTPGTQETERTMPYLTVLAVTLLLVAGSIVFVRTPPRRRKSPGAK